jgi:hypothetical protein
MVCCFMHKKHILCLAYTRKICKTCHISVTLAKLAFASNLFLSYSPNSPHTSTYVFFLHTPQTRLARVPIFDILAKLNLPESQHQHETCRRRVRKYSRHSQNSRASCHCLVKICKYVCFNKFLFDVTGRTIIA